VTECEFFDKALVYVLKMQRTEREVSIFLLRKKGCAHDVAGRIIERLKGLNYLNDAEYARMYASAKREKLSVRAIKLKLRTKGIAQSIIDELRFEDCDQSALAKAVAAKYMRSKMPDQANLARLFRYLVAKGFEYDLVGEITKEVRNANRN